jgi:hypothetical protein
MFAFIVAVNILLVPYEPVLDEMDGHVSFLTGQLNLDDEGNFTTWASSMLLVIAALGSYMLCKERSASHPYVSKLLLVMALGFVVLSIDDVAQLHDYVEQVVSGTDPDSDTDTPADEFERNLGPIFALTLTVLLGGFLAPLMRSARTGNVRYLVGCVACVAMVALSEVTYLASGCEQDWCYQLEVLFEESFEFGAIFMFLAFLMYEIFDPETSEARHPG